MEEKAKLKEAVRKLLDVPQKAKAGDENKDIERKLGDFLVDKDYIRGIDEQEEDWSFVYYSTTKKIALSAKKMPHNKWEDCIFKMGVNKETGERLFPQPGVETKKYRFLHESGHAFQEFISFKECKDNSEEFYEKSLNEEINSPYSKLFRFCFEKRKEKDECAKEGEAPKGLSVWGNAPNYSCYGNEAVVNKDSELAVRAQEDANELITMYLWHPDYLKAYLDYLSLNYNNQEVREDEITKEDLERRGLLQLKKEEANTLWKIINSYIKEMKNAL